MNYASFLKRFYATVIDSLVIILPSLIFSHILPGVGGILLSLFYKPVFEASPLSATPGKALVGIVVLTDQGHRLSLKQAYGRYFFSILSGLTLGIGYLMALFTVRKQTLHDLAIGSVVIYRETADVNYLQVWWKEIQSIFSEVKRGSLNSTSRTTESFDSSAHEIESLFKLYQAGALTEEEYQEKKFKILNRL